MIILHYSYWRFLWINLTKLLELNFQYSLFVFSLILLVFKENITTLRLTWYFQIILIGILVLAHFKKEMTISLFDKTLKIIRKYISKLNSIIKDLIAKNKNRKTSKSDEDSIEIEGVLK